jgi:protocatechuate 3,4-dioxygenase beta subunit
MVFYRYKLIFAISLVFALLLGSCRPEVQEASTGQSQETGNELSCEPTPRDALGPFYKPDAPIRESVGEGYQLSGAVLSAENCLGITGAQVELWMAGPDGEYRDEYRATVYSDDQGEYRLESHFPPPYQSRPSHIHIRVTAPGFQELVTQHYPVAGEDQAIFNLVIVPTQEGS